nr:alpha/beta fold hydrolase [Coraliomargarita parva]
MLSAETTKAPIRVACVGDSITRGGGTEAPALDAYPKQLQRLLGASNYTVGYFGSSGSTAMHNTGLAYQERSSFKQALNFKPDIVVIQLGTNDAHKTRWPKHENFSKDYRELIEAFQTLETKPKIYLSLPPVILPDSDGSLIEENAILEQIPLIKHLANETGATVIDVHGAFASQDDLKSHMGDRIHPNRKGATLIAKKVYEAITGEAFQGPVPHELYTSWKGYQRIDFGIGTRPGKLVIPENPAPGRPWIWRTEFFGAFPSVDLALLEQGWHVFYLDMVNQYGSPQAMEMMDLVPSYLKDHYDLSAKPVLEGFSRGGLYALNWSIRHPDKVKALYLDAPVCDFKSWPGGRGRGNGNKADWGRLLKAYGFSDEEALTWDGNPIDKLEPLAEAGIPIIAVAGDADEVVPMEENISLLKDRYEALGGRIELIVKPGIGHHPHSLEDPTPVVEFLQELTQPKQVSIMPLGDSITQGLVAGGYRSPLCELLINAGYEFRFVGTQEDVSVTPSLIDSGNEHHEGHAGYGTRHIINNLDGGTSNGGHWLDGLPGKREPIYPDIILLMIGTNDLGSHKREVEPTLKDFQTILDKIYAMRPEVKIIVSTLIPYTGDKYEHREANQVKFNSKLPAVIESYKQNGYDIHLYDMRQKVAAKHISNDGVHPTAQGYVAIANGWFDAITQFHQ